MSTGAIIIDGVDVSTLGVILLRGSDAELMSFPSRKNAHIIEWPDTDGFEIGDAAPVYESRSVSLQWYCKGVATEFKQRLNSFIAMHKLDRYMNVYVRELEYTFRLRYVGITSHTQNSGFSTTSDKWAKLTIEYAIDNPTQYVDALTPGTITQSNSTKVKIDDVDLGSYGIIVENVYSTAFQETAKQGIEYISVYSSGKQVGFAKVKDKHDIDITCTMRADNKQAILSNYKSLWNTIDKSSVAIELTAAERKFEAYYSSMRSLSKRAFRNNARMQFIIEFTGYEVPNDE